MMQWKGKNDLMIYINGTLSDGVKITQNKGASKILSNPFLGCPYTKEPNLP
jgi:hypothetical protein